MEFDTIILPLEPHYLAPDGSEIRLLPELLDAGLCHCRLGPGSVSWAVKHQTVNEIWYCLDGEGELWRKFGDKDAVTRLYKGVSLVIEIGMHFQFRTIGETPLDIIILTSPRWPGPHEAIKVTGNW